MPSYSANVPLSRIFRGRAAECRTMAELFRSEKTREHLLKVAADYESMAHQEATFELEDAQNAVEPVISILAHTLCSVAEARNDAAKMVARATSHQRP
jgi:hypothetical protein